MDELIKLTKTKIGAEDVNSVSGRELHAFLEVGKIFAAWMPEQIEAFGFLEHQDFEVISESGKNPQGGRPSREYILSISMAKELAMVQRSEKGKQARLYFIECERIANNPMHHLLTMSRPDMLIMAAGIAADRDALRAQNIKQQATIAVMEPKAEFHDRIADTACDQDLTSLAKELGVGRNIFFKWLYKEGFLIEKSRQPYQEYIDRGYFRVIAQSPWKDGDGVWHIPSKPLATGKGVIWLSKKWKEANP